MSEEIIQQIFRVCILPLLTILTGAICTYVKVKRDAFIAGAKSETEKKYADMLAQTITDCVLATNQTFVDSMKQQDVFNEDAQKKAFEMTYQAVIKVLSEDAKQYLTEAYGDLTIYITKKIEAEVKLNK